MKQHDQETDTELTLRGAPLALPRVRVEFAQPQAPPVAPMPGPGLIQEYSRMFRRYALRVICAGLVCALLGAALALPQRPMYRAHTALEILSPNENLVSLNSLDPASAASNGSPESYTEAQSRILQSDELIERVARKLNLENRPELFAGTWRVFQQQPARVLSRDEMIDRLKDNLTVKTSPQSRLVEVQFESSNAKLAAEFPNALASELIEQNLETRYQTARKTAEWLAGPLAALKADLERSQSTLQNYARAHGVVVGQDRTGSVPEQRLRQIQDELTRAQSDRALKQARLETARLATPGSLPDVMDVGSLRDTQAKLTELKRQLAELSATFAPTYFKVTAVQAQVTELESALAREKSSILDRLQSEYDASRRRESLLQASYEEQVWKVTQEAGVAARFDSHRSEVETNRAIYGPMLQKIKEVGIMSAIRASNVRVLTHAKTPRNPYRPKPLYQAGVGLLAGLFLATAFVMVREQTTRTIRRPGEIAAQLNLLELGSIPTHRARRMTSYQNMVAQLNTPSRGLLKGRVKSGLIDWSRDSSALAEAFRSTLASLWFAGKRTKRLRVFALTSPSAGEGKTTLVSQLGTVLANTNRRVLLIDGDVRRPRLHRLFGVDRRWGLADILESDRPIEDYSFREMFLETDVPDLYILPSGAGLGNIAGLRYHDRLLEFMTRVRLEFHAVLIDTPPVLQFADARILGGLADAVILVARAGHTSVDAIAAAQHRLQEDGITVLGSILNDWNVKDTPYGHSAYEDYALYRTSAARS